MNLWTIIAPLSSLITGIGLQLIAYDLDKSTSKILSHLVSAIGLVFIIAFFELAFAKRPFPDTANWVFLALAVMIVAVAVNKGIAHQINKNVLRICVAVLGLLVVAWLVGSCADNKRQKDQLDHLKIEDTRATDREEELSKKHNI